MLLIWGFKTFVKQLAVLFAQCGNCGHAGAQVYREHRNKFTFFFIPTFTTSTKYFKQCSFCAAHYRVQRDEVQWAQAQATMGAEQQQWPQPAPGQ